ncbi:MAG: DUF3379 family protein [Oceanisphaera sp.]|uniref:DUF3379 family protein n=1 Tax=Oceanisphaera sp. TaxID=1929979 RepID=UPI003C71F6CB
MNELEFRRRAYTNPNDDSADFIDASCANASHQQLVKELQHFDKKLKQALHEPVPDTLVNTLLQDTLQPAPSQNSQFGWRHLAIAASVTFVLGFVTRFLPLESGVSPPYQTVGQVAMEHVRLESYLTHDIDEQVTLTAVNAKLQPYGTQFKNITNVGKVYYANHCLFAGGPAAHLVIQGEHNRVHVFLVPADRALQQVNSFSDQQYHGEVIGMNLNRLVVVSDKEEDVEKMVSKIEASLERAI